MPLRSTQRNVTLSGGIRDCADRSWSKNIRGGRSSVRGRLPRVVLTVSARFRISVPASAGVHQAFPGAPYRYCHLLRGFQPAVRSGYLPFLPQSVPFVFPCGRSLFFPVGVQQRCGRFWPDGVTVSAPCRKWEAR